MKAPLFRPLGDRLLIRHPAAAEQIRGGVLIPESAREQPREATVVARGPGRRNKQGVLAGLAVGVGDKVYVAAYGGAEVVLQGEKYRVVREEDILGVLA